MPRKLPNSAKWRKIRAIYYISLFKVIKFTDFCTNRKFIYDFQWLVLTYLLYILYHFLNISFDGWVQNRHTWLSLLHLTPRRRGSIHWDDFCKKNSVDVNGWMAKVPNGVETLPKIASGWVGCTNVTDDRRTGDRLTAYSKRAREFTFADNNNNNIMPYAC